MQVSSSNLVTLTNECGGSGKFMELARNGQLMVVSEVIQNRATTTKELAEIERKLRSCNDPARLAEFAIWCTTRKVDFSSTLRQLAARLEVRKSQMLTKLLEIERRQDYWLEDWVADPGPTTCLVERLLRKRDPSLAKRDEIVDENVDLSTEEICKILDDSARGGEMIDWIPKSWARDYKIETFRQAYRHQECRNRVHKMISVRRRLRRSP